MPVFSGGAPGFADGPAAQARFRYPIGGVLDSEGNLFVADTGNFRIRKLSPDGDVTTIAGSGLVGCADGPALEAQFRFPSCLCVDWQQPGALIITDYMSHCLKLLSPSGTISTLAGGPGEGGYCDGPVLKARFMNPACPQLGPAGDLFVVDRGNHCIRRIDRGRTTVTTFAGSRRPGFKDGLATEAEFRSPSGLAIGADGTLWLSDTKNHAIRRVAPDGTVTTIAGDGTAGLADGHGAAARFDSPMPVTLDGNGNLVVSDKNNCIRLVTPAGCVTTILAPASAAQTLGCPLTCPCFPTGLALTAFSELLFSGGNQIFTVPIGLPPYRRDPVRQALGRKLADGTGADVVVVVGKHRLAAHREVLASRSLGLAARLPAAVPDAVPSRLAINNASITDVQAFLLFLYTNEMHDIGHLFGLVDLCQRFGVEDGCRRGRQYCQRHVGPAMAVQWLVESQRRGLADLTPWLQRYVHEQWQAICKVAPQSFNLLQPYPQLLEATIPDPMRLQPQIRPKFDSSSPPGQFTSFPTA